MDTSLLIFGIFSVLHYGGLIGLVVSAILLVKVGEDTVRRKKIIKWLIVFVAMMVLSVIASILIGLAGT
jgi:hypothetical protein